MARRLLFLKKEFLSGLLCAAAILVSVASAAAIAPPFTARNYTLLGSNHIIAVFKGDDKPDAAVRRPTDCYWHLMQSANGYRIEQFVSKKLFEN